MRAHRKPHLYQRGGIWWCYWQDRRWSTKTENRAEAERIVRDRYDARRTGAETAAREKTLNDAAVILFDALERRGRSAVTKKQAQEKLAHFARLWGPDCPLADVDWPKLSKYIGARLEEGAARLTVSHELGYLRQAWKLARAMSWAPRPWDEVMPERFDRRYVPKERWLTPQELDAVLRSLRPAKAAVVAWIAATGCDLGDVARATRADIDWDRGLVHVRGTKNAFRDRWVPITPATRLLLEIATAHGPPFAPWPGIQSSLAKLAVRLKMPHFSPKDLRRTFGTGLRNDGVAPHLIGRVLGHANSEMADRVYARGEDERIAKLVMRAYESEGADRPDTVRTAPLTCLPTAPVSCASTEK